MVKGGVSSASGSGSGSGSGTASNSASSGGAPVPASTQAPLSPPPRSAGTPPVCWNTLPSSGPKFKNFDLIL